MSKECGSTSCIFRLSIHVIQSVYIFAYMYDIQGHSCICIHILTVYIGKFVFMLLCKHYMIVLLIYIVKKRTSLVPQISPSPGICNYSLQALIPNGLYFLPCSRPFRHYCKYYSIISVSLMSFFYHVGQSSDVGYTVILILHLDLRWHLRANTIKVIIF